MTTTVIVTGGSSGLGRAVCARLGRGGLNVTVGYLSDPAGAEEVAGEIEEAGGAAIAVRADVTRRAGFGVLFDRAEQAFGPVDALVNGAGVSAAAPIADTGDALIRELLDVNLLGSLYGMQEAAGRLRSGGCIVNVSSSAVPAGFPGLGVLLAAKAGVEALTRVLAKELGPRGIRVNAVAPGLLDTPTFRGGKSDRDVERLAAQIPLRRLGDLQEAAAAVAYLLGADASWVNAQVLRVNGGFL
ncbi:SDR family oxidoreductase [Actinomadura macrotermitis]|uniref:Glucose 1-dehydrogenase 2 n=1 Tax=Actinomadura macrotermitis TaxID=2585200 RepID=A0A7K0C3L2_9ACTN|nr:SDR family oxidoreductase [Actinomadura macrotermitis]MQY08013.1 Glucose 1-dehydrogenase 2 [Actinomadura macrotermitis]